MIGYYAEVAPDGRYAQCHHVVLPLEVALTPVTPGNSLVAVDAPPATWAGATPTEVLHLVDGVERWVETAPIEQLRARATDAIDAAGEALRLAVVNRMPMQSEEYRRVETQARAWAAAGYPEAAAPRSVTSWAKAKHRDAWTNRQACDDILATADGWYSILDTIRELRLAKKEDVRHAQAEEIPAIRASMTAAMASLAQQMNLTITE